MCQGVAPSLSDGIEEIRLFCWHSIDGVIDSRSEELVTYRFRPDEGTLSRIVGRQSMPLATGLSSNGFKLSFFDGSGSAVDSGADAADPVSIRRLRIALTLEDPRGRHLAGASTDVGIRNRSWTR